MMERNTKRGQPPWHAPEQPASPTKLKLLNSLTRNKKDFVPSDGDSRLIKWYICGPTVYDAAHIGHARNYIAFDVIRRVLQQYFTYNVQYVMNVTDIDDKIIKRARVQHLLKQFVNRIREKQTPDADVHAALQASMAEFRTKIAREPDELKRAALQAILSKCEDGVKAFTATGSPWAANADLDAFITDAFLEPLGSYLDTREGATVRDNSIFRDLPRYWELEFHRDMAELNILPPDVLTRVSDFIPEITDFIQGIMDKGYAYQATDNSVYFNTTKFGQNDKHFYGKLLPESSGDLAALEEGEGILSAPGACGAPMPTKSNPMDFALWKAARPEGSPGEPSWQSSFGPGRPGWHIECSAMASKIFGPTLDIHAGGNDLKFPHHDNEIAQSEAHYDSDQWSNFFLHSGHLTIQGCKMSKSLKNFITIRDALSRNTARQIRLAFLLHAWHAPLDYSQSVMDSAVKYEKTVQEFFLNYKDLLRRQQLRSVGQSPQSAATEQFTPYERAGGRKLFQPMKWSDADLQLLHKLYETRQSIHVALCDSVDTRAVLEHLSRLITHSNKYLADMHNDMTLVNVDLLKQMGMQITKIFNLFGLNAEPQLFGLTSSSSVTANQTVAVMNGPRGDGISGSRVRNPNSVCVAADEVSILQPYLNVIGLFYDGVLHAARDMKCPVILKICREFRDTILPKLDVRLDDHYDFDDAVYNGRKNPDDNDAREPSEVALEPHSNVFDLYAGGEDETIVMPYLEALAKFREDVRRLAKDHKPQLDSILKLCSDVRDELLPNVGVRLEDVAAANQGGDTYIPPVIKLVGRETLMREREQRRRDEEEREAEKERKKAEAKQQLAAKREQMRIPPSMLFRLQADKYSAFDEDGLPTHNADGTEIGKGARKKLKALQEKQQAAYEKIMTEEEAANATSAAADLPKKMMNGVAD